ncbi:DtxR family iron (metal) dependent repressor [Balneicella halophila]|uniref:Transcriptional regulator MntR n=1 Tax=Balneicella halophila TaxID=1537566 RepID=A0A7L4US25_BALHA|nr:metal-dependent transcriptional regulator [Balneicella halophila]PVX52221.1 DtxR family iron (metal) dependent repressor [Balneicella halophila]
MPSDTKENYLKAIYSLEENGEKISLSALSKRIDVSIPTVNNMVKRLQEEGWVIYEKYKPIILTDEGRKVASHIVRKHRLAEMFLVETMGLGWEEVHDIAEDLEHINSETFFNRIDEMLDYPKFDPHGTPIPDKNGKTVSQNYESLSAIEPGQSAVLRALDHEQKEFLVFLNKKNIALGTEIKIEEKEPFDESVVVAYDQFKNVVLTKDVCDKLLVEKVHK